MKDISVFDDSSTQISDNELNEYSVGAMLPTIDLSGSCGKHEYDKVTVDDLIRRTNELANQSLNFTLEAKLDRSKVALSDYGIPELKKYPMPDKKHVLLAIQMFNRVDKRNEKQLAKAIFEKMKEYSITIDVIGEKNRLKKYIKGDELKLESTNLVDSMFKGFFEANENHDMSNEKTPDPIKHIVVMLEGKGYRVKYSSPGYMDSYFKRDRNKDGVINGKTASSARIIFSKDYRFNTTPKYWEWKVLDNGFKALYVKPMSENEDPNQMSKWKQKYMDSLEMWVKNLPMAGTADKEDHKEDKHFSAS